MTRARHVTPRQTAARIEKLRNLVTALLAGAMTRDEIGEVLLVGPSGVRKYLADLSGKVGVTRYVDGTEASQGLPVYGLTITAAEAQDYLAGLAIGAPTRAVTEPKSVVTIAARDPSRHFHILEDDVHYSVRVSRTPVQRDVLVAAFFGAGRHEVRV